MTEKHHENKSVEQQKPPVPLVLWLERVCTIKCDIWNTILMPVKTAASPNMNARNKVFCLVTEQRRKGSRRKKFLSSTSLFLSEAVV